MSNASQPFFWRMRGPLQKMLGWFALLVIALGAFVTVNAVIVGPIEGMAVGLPLIVGGALIFVVKRGGKS